MKVKIDNSFHDFEMNPGKFLLKIDEIKTENGTIKWIVAKKRSSFFTLIDRIFHRKCYKMENIIEALNDSKIVLNNSQKEVFRKKFLGDECNWKKKYENTPFYATLKKICNLKPTVPKTSPAPDTSPVPNPDTSPIPDTSTINDKLLHDFLAADQKYHSFDANRFVMDLQAKGIEESKITELYNEKSSALQKEAKEKAVELRNLFMSIENDLSEENSIEEIAIKMHVPPENLERLTRQYLPWESRKNKGCLHAFFAILPNQYGQVLTIFYPPKKYFDFGHPLWPENKNPSTVALTIEEFSRFLCISPQDFIELANYIKLDIDKEEKLTPEQMKIFVGFCTDPHGEFGNRARPRELYQGMCRPSFIWKLVPDMSTPWTLEKQLALK